MSDIQQLDAFEIPLQGLNLVEAAAGTGKTYNIQILVARMILECAYRIDEIVVLSYTIEAAAELRKRIQTILEKMLALLENIPVEDSKQAEAVLHCDRLHRPDAGDEQRIALIRSALRDFDLANISTINGFCQKLLGSCAFESGTPFELKLENSGSRQLDVVLDDWFRKKSYSGKGSIFIPGLISRHELNSLKSSVTDYAVEIPDYKDTDIVGTADALLKSFEADNALEKLAPGFFKSNSTINSRKSSFERALREYNAPVILELCPLYTPENLAQNVLKDSRNELEALLRTEPFFSLCQNLSDCTVQAKAALRAEAVRSSRAAFFELEKTQGFMTFADQIRLVDEALQNSAAFKELLHSKFKAGIIDEFQDTDVVQYRIFKTIFDREGGSLFLVGDPRQAIYRFRGGDINVYLKAKADALAGGRVYLLKVNYRSSVEMVNAVNQIFCGRKNPFGNPVITFEELAHRPACDAPEMLVDGVRDCRAMRRYKIEQCPAERLLEICALRINQLIASDSNERLPDGRPITPGDIAVLLNSHSECHKLRTILEKLSIPAVCLKGFNIYAGVEAAELYQLLNAVIAPGDRQRVNTALSTRMCGFLPEQLCGDDGANSDAEKFSRLHEIWFSRGFAPMFEEMLRLFNIRENLAVLPNGERHLTNLFHLEELLQSRTVQQHLSPDMLLDELGRRIAVSGDRDELEEDFEEQLSSGVMAVKIMTVHASKGLQFPLVMLPGLQQFTTPADNKLGAVYFDGSVRSLNLEHDEAKKELIRRELFEEMLRLIYVAVTRAEYRCEIFESSALNNSAWDYLVNDGSSTSTVGYMPLEIDFDVQGNWSNPTVLKDELPEFPEQTPHWQVISYSFLTRNVSSIAPVGIPLDHDDNSAAAEEVTPSMPDASVFSPFALPGGSSFGSALHEILEKLPFDAPESDFTEALAGTVQHFIPELPQDKMAAFIQQAGNWLHGIMHCRIEDFDGEYFTLADIEPADRLSELEFYCGLGAFDLAGVRRVLDEYVHSPELELVSWPAGWEQELSGGVLNGFIDLVFRRKGKYYIADWKSNRLDGIPGNFSPEALKKEMVSSFYFIQYLLYTVALVRHLRRFSSGCFGEAEYERSFGGIYYFFVRGMAIHQEMRGVFRARPPWSVVKALEDLICTGM